MMTSKVFVIFTISLLEVFSAAESDYVDEFLGGQDLPQMRLNYPPALRRRPNQFNDMSSIDFDQEFLDQLVDEQARRRFHKHMEALSRQFNYNLNSRLRDRLSFKNPFPSEGEPSTSYNSPDFEYNLPKASSSNGDIVFGLTPSDSRYKVDEEVESYDNDDFKPQQQHSASPDVAENEQQVLFKFINPQKINNFKTQSIFNPGSVGQDIKTVPHLQRPLAENNNFVMKESMGLESDTNVYVVALIAGVTAAVTVGLIVLVVAWYTLHKKSKAASDMEYPAYGVTGPCREISQTSGDKRLAQSAEIYHYQHQKQQIIAMEKNVPNDLNNAAISDVESEDDNEEGDYTVYECPGLAPTCEMEVKNPLFLDETPVTPSGGKNQNAE